MAYINLSKRFSEKNALEGCKEIFKKMNKKTASSGCYEICEDQLISPEILAVILKSGYNLNIFLFDNGLCPTSCNVKILSKKDNKEGKIVKISFDGPPNHREKDAKAYKRKILEVKNSVDCENILRKLNNMYMKK